LLIHMFERAVTLLFQTDAVVDGTVPTSAAITNDDVAAMKKAADHSHREFMSMAPNAEEGQPLSLCEDVAQTLFNLSLTLDVLHTALVAMDRQHPRNLGNLFQETATRARLSVKQASQEAERAVRLWWNEVKSQDGERKAVKAG
jgi:hypothetical protein